SMNSIECEQKDSKRNYQMRKVTCKNLKNRTLRRIQSVKAIPTASKTKLNDVDEEVVVPVMNVGNKNIEVCKGQVLDRNVKILNSSMGHETTNDRSGSVITSDEVKTGEK
ncbi:hypothetical protein CBL_21425, partial [Carabus blaptoides fortunei]